MHLISHCALIGIYNTDFTARTERVVKTGSGYALMRDMRLITVIIYIIVSYNISPARYVFFPLLHLHSSFDLENTIKHSANHSKKSLVAVVPITIEESYDETS